MENLENHLKTKYTTRACKAGSQRLFALNYASNEFFEAGSENSFGEQLSRCISSLELQKVSHNSRESGVRNNFWREDNVRGDNVSFDLSSHPFALPLGCEYFWQLTWPVRTPAVYFQSCNAFSTIRRNAYQNY